MPPQQQNRLVAWYLLVKDEWLPGQWQRLVAWSAAARREPYLIWQTPQIRYAVYGLGALAGVWLLVWMATLLEPAPSQGVRSRAQTANFHVVCSNPQCKHHFVIVRKFGFKRFPVTCTRCDQKSCQRARRCFSPTCNRRFVIPITSEARLRCSECGADLGEAP